MTNQSSTKQLTAKLVKSNASEHLVWEISITNSRCKKHYCKTARKALNCIFLIKNEKNIPVSYETLRYLKSIIAKQKGVGSAIENASSGVQ